MAQEYYGVIGRINAALARIEAVAAQSQPARVGSGDHDAHDRLKAAATQAVAALDALIVTRSR